MSKALQARLARLEQRQKAADEAPEPIDRIIIAGMSRDCDELVKVDTNAIVIDVRHTAGQKDGKDLRRSLVTVAH